MQMGCNYVHLHIRMKKNPGSALLLAALLGLLFITGCKTDFEVNAPYKEMYQIVCVLNPKDTIQYIRVSKVFLTETNAIVYASENDQSAKNVSITVSGDGKTWTARQIDGVVMPGGMFYSPQTIYAIDTKGSVKLKAGKTYSISLTPQGSDKVLTAQTSVPDSFVVINPPGPQYGAGTTRCNPEAALDMSYSLKFKKAANALAYELRVYLAYQRNGVPDTAMFGPTEYFTASSGCTSSSSEICQNLGENEVLAGWLQELIPGGATYTYDDGGITPCRTNINDLNRSIWFEVTAIDEHLYYYMLANDPKYSDFTGARPEYTNFSDGAIGVFGSYNLSSRYVDLNECSKYLMSLNGTPPPSSFCQ